jgi:hypothetical protein
MIRYQLELHLSITSAYVVFILLTYKSESNENLKYFLSRNLLNTKGNNDFIFLCILHCILYKRSNASEVHAYF